MLGLQVKFVSLLGISMLWFISHVLAALFVLCPPWKAGPNQPYFEMLPSTLFNVLIHVETYCGVLAVELAAVISDNMTISLSAAFFRVVDIITSSQGLKDCLLSFVRAGHRSTVRGVFCCSCTVP